VSRWDLKTLQQRGTRPWEPQTGVEDNQGPPSMMPGALEALQVPIQPGYDNPGFINPYVMNHYGPITIPTTAAIIILQSNSKRCYLLIQNQGPGNVWVGFGRNVTIAGDGYQIFPGGNIEHIGGGFMTMNGRSIPQAFVASDLITAISDNAVTVVCAGEGIARFPVG